MEAHRNLIPQPIKVTPGIYRHFKGGLYQVLGLTRHSETKEQLVVYQQLGRDETWVRPYKMFIETISQNGACEPRFTRVADSVEEIAPETSMKVMRPRSSAHPIEAVAARFRAFMPWKRQKAC